MLSYSVSFSKSEQQIKWHGCHVIDKKAFQSYLKGPVYKRLVDEESKSSFETDVANLATTQMAQETLKQLLSSQPDAAPWEIGEAIAECILEEEHKVKWPWNMERDKRTPKASLPGADLIGLLEENDSCYFVLGEVKTSEDPTKPPHVLYGRSGMIYQLDQLANKVEIHSCIIKWLYVRCKATNLQPVFEKAMANYLQSGGKAVLLFGVLLRYANPDEIDLKSRVSSLINAVKHPTKMELEAWYFPHSISDWPILINGKQP